MFNTQKKTTFSCFSFSCVRISCLSVGSKQDVFRLWTSGGTQTRNVSDKILSNLKLIPCVLWAKHASDQSGSGHPWLCPLTLMRGCLHRGHWWCKWWWGGCLTWWLSLTRCSHNSHTDEPQHKPPPPEMWCARVQAKQKKRKEKKAGGIHLYPNSR